MLKKSLLAPMAVAVICLGAAPAAGASDDSPAVSAPAAPPAVNGITQAAVSGGVLSCAGRINQVANFLTGGSLGVGAFLFTSPVDPDQRLASVSLEIPAGAGASSTYASASFAPNQSNGCGGIYESVVYWPEKCEEVAAKNLRTLRRVGILAQTITVLDVGWSTKIFLMPAGNGCVSIKKEVVQ